MQPEIPRSCLRPAAGPSAGRLLPSFAAFCPLLRSCPLADLLFCLLPLIMKRCHIWVRLAALGAVVGLSGCAASTPGSRVAQAPQLYQALPEAQQQAVREGRVVEGMTPDGVYLALGRPDRVWRGSENGKPYEQWRYAELRPEYRAGLSVSYGYPYGWGRYGGGFYDPWWPGLALEPDYLPVTTFVVRFSRNRVTGWEQLR